MVSCPCAWTCCYLASSEWILGYEKFESGQQKCIRIATIQAESHQHAHAPVHEILSIASSERAALILDTSLKEQRPMSWDILRKLASDYGVELIEERISVE